MNRGPARRKREVVERYGRSVSVDGTRVDTGKCLVNLVIEHRFFYQGELANPRARYRVANAWDMCTAQLCTGREQEAFKCMCGALGRTPYVRVRRGRHGGARGGHAGRGGYAHAPARPAAMGHVARRGRGLRPPHARHRRGRDARHVAWHSHHRPPRRFLRPIDLHRRAHGLVARCGGHGGATPLGVRASRRPAPAAAALAWRQIKSAPKAETSGSSGSPATTRSKTGRRRGASQSRREDIEHPFAARDLHLPLEHRSSTR